MQTLALELRSMQPLHFSTRSLGSHLAIERNYTAFTQDIDKPATEKWRPKEGTYAAPGADFSQRCGEEGDVIVELKGNSISGNEWSCKVTRLTDTAPGRHQARHGLLRLQPRGVYQYSKNPNPEERKFKEIMLLRKIDGKSMFVRKTLNGKFKNPDWRAYYCPEDAQHMYIGAVASNKAEAEQKAVEAKSVAPAGRRLPNLGREFRGAVPKNQRCDHRTYGKIDFQWRR